NSGLLALGAVLAAVALRAPRDDDGGPAAALGPVLALGLVAGALALVRPHAEPWLLTVTVLPLAPLAVALATARPGRAACLEAAAPLVGSAAVVTPVVAALVVHAGGAAVARDLLQLGTDTPLVYFTPYPDARTALAAVAAVAGALRRLRLAADYAWFA